MAPTGDLRPNPNVGEAETLMSNRSFMLRVAVALVAVPATVLLFNALGTALGDVWHHEAAQFLKVGGEIATAKLKAYWFTRHLFLFLGTLGGLVISQACYLLLRSKI
jgi:hypothetical protein